MTPVVIDTDPGIDDAIAILWAAASPALDLRALTTVGGNVGLSVVTQNALDLLALAGHTAPVHAGANHPLARPPVAETRIHGTGGLGGVTLPLASRAADLMPAVPALEELLTGAPERSIDLLLLGPMTNLALLLRDAPEAASRIGRVIAMGGAVDAPGNVAHGAEFNIAHDPEAAAQVFEAGLDLTLIPLDCTRQLRATRAWATSLTGERGSIAGALIAAYFDAIEGAESRPLHDPCVPLLATAPGLFRIEPRALAVDLDQRPGVLVPGPHTVNVAMAIDADAARRLLRSGLS